MDRRTARFLAWSFVGSAVALAGVDLALVVLAWGAPAPTGSFGILGFAAVIGVSAAYASYAVLARSGSVPERVDLVVDLDSGPDVSHADAVHDRGELLGALSITKGPTDPVTPTEQKLVGDLAHQAGLVLRNARLVDDLRASRQRLVTAQDQERRRLERNIHDGAQQQLVALAVKVQLADRAVDADAEAAHWLLNEIQEETRDALETLRDLARGIYPPLLADEGLVAALTAHARKVPLSVEVRADGVGRRPQEVEAAAYFCCLEALQNATKYSGATTVRVELAVTDGRLAFDVVDDGRGFDPTATRPGAGLQNMSDRLEAVGGSLEIRSSPGTGTTIAGRIPVGEVATR